MVNQSSGNLFAEKNNNLLNQIKKLDKKSSNISTMRVICFLLGAALLIIGVSDKIKIAGIAGGVFLLIFIALVKYHSDVIKQLDITKSKHQVVDRYIKRNNEKWHSFSDDGKEFVSLENTVASDVDLLGRDSLYQMINVCHTNIGRKKLAKRLKLKNIDIDNIKKRQAAIGELIELKDFAVDFEAAGIRLEQQKKKFDTDSFVEYCNDENSGIIPVWAKVLRVAMPVTEILFIVLWVLGVTGYGLPLAGFLILLITTWLTKSVTDAVILPIYNLSFVSEEYEDMLQLIAKQEFKSEYLIDIKNKITKEKGILKSYKELRKIVQSYNISFNPLIHQLLSGVVLWDYQLACLVGSWKKTYGLNFSSCFDIIGDVEEMLSFATLGMVRETNWPQVNYAEKDMTCLECQDLYHPLINPEKVQPNGISLKGGITVITGSNMSGKTTFLRTLAINLALAYVGAPVCGKKLVADYMEIFTSMRVTDDVANGISTFYAEILRIKAMAEYKKNNKPMICLIDEIFKGTNSADRIVGATEAITRLAGSNSITIVSTHDFELCKLEDKEGNLAENYHFEEYYEDGQLKFDYKIKDGRCTTTNARAILRMAGFEVAD